MNWTILDKMQYGQAQGSTLSWNNQMHKVGDPWLAWSMAEKNLGIIVDNKLDTSLYCNKGHLRWILGRTF